jgi:recombinational DNA repair protein (RecF pathway)
MLVCRNCNQRIAPGKAYLVREEYYCNHCFDQVTKQPGKDEKPVTASINNALEDVVIDAVEEKKKRKTR